MRLNAPKKVVWIIAVILGIVGVVAELAKIAAIEPYAFWLVLVGLVLLTLSTWLKGF
ncbi:hypothetical protein JXJ21_15455 [candidate division KSB1 bacterium]|nr:hypothetical protein [candidate division KSB1 bacterium]